QTLNRGQIKFRLDGRRIVVYQAHPHPTVRCLPRRPFHSLDVHRRPGGGGGSQEPARLWAMPARRPHHFSIRQIILRAALTRDQPLYEAADAFVAHGDVGTGINSDPSAPEDGPREARRLIDAAAISRSVPLQVAAVHGAQEGSFVLLPVV